MHSNRLNPLFCVVSREFCGSVVSEHRRGFWDRGFAAGNFFVLVTYGCFVVAFVSRALLDYSATLPGLGRLLPNIATTLLPAPRQLPLLWRAEFYHVSNRLFKLSLHLTARGSLHDVLNCKMSNINPNGPPYSSAPTRLRDQVASNGALPGLHGSQDFDTSEFSDQFSSQLELFPQAPLFLGQQNATIDAFHTGHQGQWGSVFQGNFNQFPDAHLDFEVPIPAPPAWPAIHSTIFSAPQLVGLPYTTPLNEDPGNVFRGLTLANQGSLGGALGTNNYPHETSHASPWVCQQLSNHFSALDSSLLNFDNTTSEPLVRQTEPRFSTGHMAEPLQKARPPGCQETGSLSGRPDLALEKLHGVEITADSLPDTAHVSQQQPLVIEPAVVCYGMVS